MAQQGLTARRGAPRGRFGSLPNLLTYGRILAIPALVGCFFVISDWGRWVAMWIFIAAGVTDILDGYLARLGAAKCRRPHARSHRRQADRLGGPADARRRRHHRRLVAVGRA